MKNKNRVVYTLKDEVTSSDLKELGIKEVSLVFTLRDVYKNDVHTSEGFVIPKSFIKGGVV